MNRPLFGMVSLLLLLSSFGCIDSDTTQEKELSSHTTITKEAVKSDSSETVDTVSRKSGSEGAIPQKIPTEATDVSGHPAEKEIKEIIKLGVVELDEQGQFKPDEIIMRGEFILWLYKLDTRGIKPHKPSKSSYPDLASDDPRYEVVEGLTASGLLVGYPDGTIKLDKELSREEMAFIWAIYAQNPIVANNKDGFCEILLSNYDDHKKITKAYINSVYAYREIWEKAYGGMPSLLPQASVTRAQAAKWAILCKETKV